MSAMERDNFLKSLNRILFSERVDTLEDAVAWARIKFEENFVHDPLSWQHSFPRDALTNSGGCFSPLSISLLLLSVWRPHSGAFSCVNLACAYVIVFLHGDDELFADARGCLFFD